MHGVEEASQLLGATHVGRFVAQLTINLCQCGRTQRVVAVAQVNQQQRGVVLVSAQLRCHGVADIFNTRKGRDNQRQWRGHLALFSAFLPTRFH